MLGLLLLSVSVSLSLSLSLSQSLSISACVCLYPCVCLRSLSPSPEKYGNITLTKKDEMIMTKIMPMWRQTGLAYTNRNTWPWYTAL